MKASKLSSDLVLCTDSKTFKVREAHHSNSLFAMDGSSSKLRLLSNISTFWETTGIDVSNTSGRAELLEKVPRYYGAQEHSLGKSKISAPTSSAGLNRKRPDSVEVLQNRTPVSDAEFTELWRRHAGVEFKVDEGLEAYILSDEVIHDVLKDVLVSMKTVGDSIKSVSPTKIFNQLAEDQDFEELPPVVTSVIKKFATSSQERKSN